jgi:hypothetical protein
VRSQELEDLTVVALQARCAAAGPSIKKREKEKK